MSTGNKTFVFIGASGGVGLSALKATLAAGHQCVALCRTPSKLEEALQPEEKKNLRIVQGDAHDVAAVSACLRREDGTLADAVVSTIGARPSTKTTADDFKVCRKGMATLLESLAQLRRDGAAGRPLVVVCSSTGISKFGRDIPLAMVPLYKVLLHPAHVDKRDMEDQLLQSGEEFAIVRPSMFATGKTGKTVRVGTEDPRTGPEHLEIGYVISREDVGTWIADNLLIKTEAKYTNKMISVTH